MLYRLLHNLKAASHLPNERPNRRVAACLRLNVADAITERLDLSRMPVVLSLAVRRRLRRKVVQHRLSRVLHYKCANSLSNNANDFPVCAALNRLYKRRLAMRVNSLVVLR